MELQPDKRKSNHTIVTIENEFESLVMLNAIIARRPRLLSPLTPGFNRRLDYVGHILAHHAESFPNDVSFKDSDLKDVYSRLKPWEINSGLDQEHNQVYTEAIHATATTLSTYFESKT